MPGETVQIRDGYVYIDGKRLTSDIYGKEKIKDPQTAAEPVTLGDDEYFVMGDNRNHSMDSRDPGVGVLTRKDLIGRAWVRIYPFEQYRSDPNMNKREERKTEKTAGKASERTGAYRSNERL